MISWRRLSLIFPLTVLILSACQSGNPNAPAKVSGTVTYKGSPVTGGDLRFHYAQGGVLNAPITSSGTYATSDLPVGDVVVTVETESLNPNTKTPEYKGGKMPGGMPGMGPRPGGGPPPGSKMSTSPRPDNAPQSDVKYVKVPAQYSAKEKSPLKATIKAGSQTLNFDLTD